VILVTGSGDVSENYSEISEKILLAAQKSFFNHSKACFAANSTRPSGSKDGEFAAATPR